MGRDLSQQDLFKNAPVWYEGLTGRRKLFVEYYCTDKTCFLNATAAYIKAYGCRGRELTESSIQSNSSRMMRDVKIKDSISRLLRAHQNEEDKISEYQILGLLKKLSLYNPADIIDRDGNLVKSLEELGDLSVCVVGIKKSKAGKEIKLFDRTKSLALLCEYLNITRPAEGTTIINPVVYMTDKDMSQLESEAAAAASAGEAVEADYEVMNREEDDDIAGDGGYPGAGDE